ncbi:MAG: thiosulfate oxidation carrier protein SoxY [Gammaproteobacteria bacterium]|nr:thiosulfate oxidation carrier protein SoxY [Gammaproteobacteria bacterium]
MNQSRRTFLKASLAVGGVAVAAGAGLLAPSRVLAASWPDKAFAATSVKDALSILEGSADTTESKDISVDAPDIAENGAVVSIGVETSLPSTESISIMVPKNANPLAAQYLLSKDAEGYINLRVKMRETSDVIAVVQSNGKLYSAKKSVKVTLGGCGG